jgi:hypothetical protein
VADDCTRECLALIADTSISRMRVARKLDRLLSERGKTKTIVSDNGHRTAWKWHLAMGRRSQRRLALHCARQADAERFRRKLHRPLGRVPRFVLLRPG